MRSRIMAHPLSVSQTKTTESGLAEVSQPKLSALSLFDSRYLDLCFSLIQDKRGRGDMSGCALGWIVEKQLITVWVIDHQDPVSPRALLHRNPLGLEFRTQRVQRGNCALA